MKKFALIVLAAMAACSEPAPPPEKAVIPPDVRAGSELVLETLIGAQTEGRLSGELGCSFRAGEDVLLIAMGVVVSQTPSDALVKRDGVLADLEATAPGGFNTLDDGETFVGGGLTIEVATAAEIATRTEEVRHSATLTARADDAVRVYEGEWNCGP